MYSKPPSSNPGTGDRVESGDREHGHLQEADLDQMVVSLDNISCSLYPYDTELHDSSRSSRDNLSIVSRGQNVSLPSHNAGSSTQSPPWRRIYTYNSTRAHKSSPELGGRAHWRVADLHDEITQHRRISQFFPQPRSDSPAVSIELLSPVEISSSPDRIPPVSSIEQPTELPRVGASSEIHTDDVKIPPELNHRHIYPVVPELFFHESNGDGLL